MSAAIRMARWTPAWFSAGLAMLCLALALLVAGFGPPSAPWEAGESRALLHLVVLGWIGSAMIGALLQFVPVLTAVPLGQERLAPLALGLWLAGVLCLVVGFWQELPGAMLLAAGLLPLAGTMVLAMLSKPILSALRHEPLVRLLALALVGMAVTILLGAGFTLALAGVAGPAPLPGIRLLHALMGLGLWFSLAAIAVSLRFLAMFGLTPPAPPRGLLWLTGLALATAVTALALRWDASPAWPMLPASAAVALYLTLGWRMLRARKLRRPDPALRGATASGIGLGAAVLVLAVAPFFGQPVALAGGAMLVLGWLSGLTLSFMPRIAAFLTWLEVFSSLMGRGGVPQAAALSDARLLMRGLRLWAVATPCFALSLAFDMALPARIAALALLLAALQTARECFRIRRLQQLPREQRPHPPSFLTIHP